MSRQIKKLSKELTDYTFVDDIARANIDVISDSLNDLEIPDKTSDLTNDSGFVTKQETDDLYASKSDIEELKLFKFPNATIFGTPTIQNGQVSNFTNDNYLQFPFLVDFQNRPFVIRFSFTTPNNMSGQENILDSNFGLAFAIREGKVVAVASDNGTSWTTGELISDETLSPNTTYYFNIYWINGKFGYAGGLSKDDTTIIKETTMINTPYPKTIVIGRSYVNGGNHYNGSINLNDASLEISNKVVWQGMDDVGLATRAAVDLSNIDAKGVEVIENIVDNKITTKQDILVSGTNIKTINNQSIIGSGNITIQGGEGGGSNVINLTQEEYDVLEDKDPNTIYNITDAQDIDVYSKSQVYSKTEADSKFSLKGEGKTYTGASGVTVNNTTNTIGVNAISALAFSNYQNYVAVVINSTTTATQSTKGYIRKLTVNGVTETLNTTTALNLDSVYAKKSDVPDVSNYLTSSSLKTINGETIVGSGNITITPNNEWVGTQEQYDALATKDPNITYYII